MAHSSPSTPSEGEIVESDSEKATTSLLTVNGTNVDRQSRKRVSVSRSPTPIRSPIRRKSRTRSRSPYRESRGSKRLREDDSYSDRMREDPRHFKIRYEDRSTGIQRNLQRRFDDLDRPEHPDPRLRYDDRSAGRRPPDKRPRARSRSPVRARLGRTDHSRKSRDDRGGRSDGHGWRGRNGPGYGESNGRLSSQQSVSDRGFSPVAAASVTHEAETKNHQTQHLNSSKPISHQPANEYVPQSHSSSSADLLPGSKLSAPTDNEQEQAQADIARAVDEATLIDERRKRREAIKAKYRGQATPLRLEAMALDSASASATPKQSTPEVQSQTPVTSPKQSPPTTSMDAPGQESPTAFVVTRDADLANSGAVTNEVVQEDEPSAADYDPTMDMQEDRMRNDQRHQGEEMSSGAYDETATAKQDVLLPDHIIDKPVAKNPSGEFDMFADEDEIDMFADAPLPAEKGPEREAAKAVTVVQTKALDLSMLDDWDDSEGYYKVILGELLDSRYHVQSNLGKGMFSGVVRALDQKAKGLVAIKIIRNNESMKKAGLKEIEILQKLSQADPEDRKHMIRLERYFEHKGHLCIVFENLSINLREVLKKFGRDVGINLKAVRAYAQQMFMGLSLLRKCNILHADLKPDNVLVSESRNVLKICDLGSASDASENEITPYLVSRFYRAPEIILGMPYDFAIDVWSIGCTLFELYTGKILFTGRSNNQMLRAIMECRGKFSHKVLRKAQFAGLHFDDLLNFRSVEKDRLSGKDVVRILSFIKPTRDLRTRLLANAKGMDDVELKELNLFVDLLERCLNLNPEKRCSPMEALKHPFIMRVKM